MKSFFKRPFAVVAALASCFALTGCLSHWFVDSSSRLQFQNATSSKTVVGLDIVASDSEFETWINETVLPGERSRVHEEDWVGNFTLRVRYTNSVDGSGEQSKHVFVTELDGGSLFLVVEESGDSISVRFR